MLQNTETQGFPQNLEKIHSSQNGGPHLAAIDGMRAVAVLAVMLFHLSSDALPGGFVGVDIFFVISGYVVSGSIIRDRELPWSRFVSAFYARRFRRIVPALVLCLVVTFVAQTAFIPDAWLSRAIANTGKSAFLGFTNYSLIWNSDGYFAPATSFNPFTHMWSLAVEEQYYLFFPFIAYFSQKKDHTITVLLSRIILTLLVLLSILYCTWNSFFAPSQAYYLLPSRFWELGVGAAVYLIGPRRRQIVVDALGSRVVIASGLSCIALAMIFAGERQFPFPWAFPPVIGSVLLIFAISCGSQSIIVNALSCRPMVLVGLRSYSLYLWHWPVYTILRWTMGLARPLDLLIAVLFTISLAEMSYRFVERPALSSAAVRRWPDLFTIAAGLALLISGRAFASFVTAKSDWFSFTTVAANRIDWYPAPSKGTRSGAEICDTLQSDEGLNTAYFRPSKCAGHPALFGRKLFVVGDSHASAYDRMLEIAARQTGLTVVRFVKGGCPWFDFRRIEPVFEPDCPAFKAKVLEAISVESKPGDVVFVTSLRIPRLIGQTGFGSHEEEALQAYSRAATVKELPGEHELRDVADRLKAKGLRLLVDLPKPVLAAPPFRCSDPFNRMNPICEHGLTVDRLYLEHLRQPVVARLLKFAELKSEIAVWDPFPVLCPSGPKCSAFRNGRPIFFDGDHLSGYGNEVLANSFINELKTTFTDGLR